MSIRNTDPDSWSTRELDMYEQLISDGIAAADKGRGTVDHVTARRIAVWLIAQPQQQPDFTRGLKLFARTGAITQDLRWQLRHRARRPGHPHAPQAARLLQYTAARGGDLAPISPDFAAICDQFDRADAMLYDLRHRTSQGERPPEPAWPDIDGQPIIALARRETGTQTVTFVLDGATANAAIYAIVAHATEREAHIREVQRKAQTFPEKSHGRANRQAIAARETRITTRLRALEHAYQQALEFQGTPSLKVPDITISANQEADQDLELG